MHGHRCDPAKGAVIRGSVGPRRALLPTYTLCPRIDLEEDPNRLPATVVDVAFLGSVVRAQTTVGPDETPVYVDTFNNPNLAVPPAGSPVVLSFPPEGCLVLGQIAIPDRTDALAAAEASL